MLAATTGDCMSIAKAKALADEWADQKKHSDYEAAVCSHFAGVTPHQLIGMWTTGKNLQGKPLSQFEAQAVAERWCAVFGELPPDDDEGEADTAAHSEPTDAPPELPPDDTMLKAKEVVRLTGVSLATLKRMAIDGRFPKPMRPHPRRICWSARDVRLWREGIESARAKGRY